MCVLKHTKAHSHTSKPSRPAGETDRNVYVYKMSNHVEDRSMTPTPPHSPRGTLWFCAGDWDEVLISSSSNACAYKKEYALST